MVNSQPVEGLSHDSERLQVVNIWETIQGEGPHAGTPAVFIRLAGCNLQCPLCDTDYTNGRRTVVPSDILLEVSHLRRSGLVVITGGEPFRQDLSHLISRLLFGGYRVQIETNGTVFPGGMSHLLSDIDIVCSPKTPKIATELGSYITAYKYVVEFGHTSTLDGLPTRVLGADCNVARPLRYNRPTRSIDSPQPDIFIQPADEDTPEANAMNLFQAVDVCMKFGYRLCLQVHKIVGLP